ncbi:hypothetical protein D3C78_1635070 [compost metagenome]
MIFDDLLADVKTNAHSRITFLDFTYSIKALEDFLQLIFLNAHSLIFYGNFNEVAHFGCVNFNLRRIGRIFDGIADQIGQYLDQM